MADIRLLERTLAATVPLNKARRNFLARFVVALLRVKTVNLSEVASAFSGRALPVLWRVLEKKGCASTGEKLEVVERFVRLFGAGSVGFLAADREFADRKLFRYLRAAGIDFRIRVKRNALVANGRGQVVQAWRLFRSQRT